MLFFDKNNFDNAMDSDHAFNQVIKDISASEVLISDLLSKNAISNDEYLSIYMFRESTGHSYLSGISKMNLIEKCFSNDLLNKSEEGVIQEEVHQKNHTNNHNNDKYLEMINHFDAELKDTIVKKMNQIILDASTSDEESMISDLRDISDIIQGILSASIKVNESKSIDILQLMVGCLDFVLSNINQIYEDTILNCINNLLRGVDILWEIRTFILSSGTIDLYLDNEVSKINYNTVRGNLMDFIINNNSSNREGL